MARLVTQVERARGAWEATAPKGKRVLANLKKQARILSTLASNAIEGIGTSPQRGDAVAGGTAEPETKDELEIVGYRDALALVQENYGAMAVSPGVILQLHRDLYGRTGASMGGRYKDADNAIVEMGPDGKPSVRFTPVAAARTPEAVETLCVAWNRATDEAVASPLLLTAGLTLDFTCIHPFVDGNGRMSRLLTQLLLLKGGYDAVLYAPLEAVIDDDRNGYYGALRASSVGWHENAQDLKPFLLFHLETVLKVYQRAMNASKARPPRTKAERIQEFMDGHAEPVTKAEILAANPDMSEITVKRALAEAVSSGRYRIEGSGRSSRYVRVEENG